MNSLYIRVILDLMYVYYINFSIVCGPPWIARPTTITYLVCGVSDKDEAADL